MKTLKKKSLQRVASILLSASLIASTLGLGTVALAAETTTSTSVTAQVALKDIGNSYAQKEIEALVSTGIISGFEDGTFKPAEPMTRAQLAKVLVLSLGLKEAPQGSDMFKDVPKDAWYRGFIGALVQSGITDGTSATTFSPDSQVSREQLAVFFVRAFGLAEQAKQVAVDVPLADLNEIADWARPYVAMAFKMGFIQGIDNGNGTVRFNPKANAERQALARLAYEFNVNRDAFKKKAGELLAGIVPAAPTTPATPATPDTVTPPVGGGGGGGSSSSRDNRPSQESVINSGGTINGNVTLGAGTYGPTSGTAVINGTLTLNPGETGEVTLNNIQATNVVIASGAANSIRLKNVKITIKLSVDAGNQTATVRIVAEGSTQVAATDVSSKATIEVGADSTGTGFGAITLNPTSANQHVDLRGNITGNITVTGSQSLALNVFGSVGTIQAESKVQINAGKDASVGEVRLNSSNAKVSLSGEGAVQSVVAAVAGALLNIADGIQVTKLKIDVKITLEVSKETIKDISLEIPADVLQDLINNVSQDILNAFKLAVAKDDLNVGFSAGDSKTSVTNNLTLLPSSTNGATVTWSSSNTSVISNSGAVTRPQSGGAANVSLTATVSLQGITTKKLFQLKVIPLTSLSIGMAVGVINKNEVSALVKPLSASNQEIIFTIPGGASAVDMLTVLKFSAHDAKEMTFTEGPNSKTVSFTNDVSEVSISDILNGLQGSQDNGTAGASIGKIRELINSDSDQTLVISGVLKDANNNQVNLTVKVTAAEVINISAAWFKIGGVDTQVTSINGSTVNFIIPSSLPDTSKVTELKMTASGTPKRLEFTIPATTSSAAPVVRTVNFASNGTASETIANLLGNLDPTGDGVSVNVLRMLAGTGQDISGYLYDAQGFPKQVTLHIAAQ